MPQTHPSSVVDKVSDPGHPLWSTIRLAIVMISLTLVLWMNASNFDETELRTIILTFIAASSTESIGLVIKRISELAKK